MLKDALLAADDALGLSARMRDPERFLGLDDNVLRDIEMYGAGAAAGKGLHGRHLLGGSGSSSQEQQQQQQRQDTADIDAGLSSLRQAQCLVQRIRTGRLYACVNELDVPWACVKAGSWKEVRHLKDGGALHYWSCPALRCTAPRCTALHGLHERYLAE